MKILVRRKGFAIIKPPEGITKYFHGQNTLITNPVWEEFHRDQPLIRAVNILDIDLDVGEYDATLTWQYLSNISNTWYNTKDPRGFVTLGLPVRLVFVKKYNNTSSSNISSVKCKICKVPLYKVEEKEGICSYCVDSKKGTETIKEQFKKEVLL